MKKMLLAIMLAFTCSAFVSAQIDTTVVVYSWKLDEYYAKRIRTPVDTSLDNFQRHNPDLPIYTALATLGNYSLPAQSLLYTERPQNQEYILINNFYPFMKLFENTPYFNTRKPFTLLTYVKGGSSQNKEEILDVFHTQNLTKTLNFSLHYTTVGAIGQYRFQKVKNNSFNFTSSLSGKVYSYYLSLSRNKIVADENGGVLHDSLVTDTAYAFTKDIPTLFGGTDNPPRHFPDVSSEIRNINVLAIQEIAFRGNRQKPDSATKAKKLRIFYPKLMYIFSLNRTIRLFTDKNPSVGIDHNLYRALNVSNTLTSDSLMYWKMSHTARLQFQGRKNNHYFIDYSYELMNYTMSVISDHPASDSAKYMWFITDELKLPGLTYQSRLYNSFVSSGFTKVFSDRLELNLFGRYFLAGYRAGDFNLNGEMKLILGKTNRPMIISVRGANELKTPDFLYAHYASNNFIWSKNFNKTTVNHLSTNLSVSSKKIEMQGDYFLLSNLIYIDKEAVPNQYRTAMSVFMLSLSKRFDFWKITSINKIVYQKSENRNVLDLPEITIVNSTYLTKPINFKATGGKLLTMIGFDFFYNTRYYADAYNPALSSFCRQTEKKLGNYPWFDAFVNVQLKRFRFYLKLQHVNAGWIDKNYFSVLHYPKNWRDIKFGVSWTFYD